MIPTGRAEPTPGPIGRPIRYQMMKKITQITSRITAIGRRLEIRVPIFISFMYFVCAVARTIQIYGDIGVTAFVGESPSL